LQHLYFGTPFQAFRKRLIRESGSKFIPQTNYVWKVNSLKVPIHYVDLLSGENEKGELIFDPEKQTGKTLRALCSDFYRPLRPSELAARIFAGEYYNPISTPNRVHKALHRFRQDAAKLGFPIVIEQEHGFQIKVRSDFGFVVYDDLPAGLNLNAVSENFNDSPFTVSELEGYFRNSRRSIQNWISQMVEAGEIIKIGDGRATKYVMTKKKAG
jgi:hypothetical protein